MAGSTVEDRTFAYELGYLKSLPRAGWLRAGITDGESVAAHSWRVAVPAFAPAVIEGADAERAALWLFHDIPETRYGDVRASGKAYVTQVPAVDVVADQTAGLPEELAECIRAAVAEHESAKQPGASIEALCSRDTDTLDPLLTARKYQDAGRGAASMDRFVRSMIPLITTATGKALAEAALAVPPTAWRDEFARKFGTAKAIERPKRKSYDQLDQMIGTFWPPQSHARPRRSSPGTRPTFPRTAWILGIS
ncbi:HD domain-containing protein [Nocardia cyriacigeorgica]|uniref:HD domain-containing protein n=1 Tax=Nocardia cyriacigeorgica TaxID=135487 RepID=A0A6P1D7E7_9NOCA|nr:HD domain-containing protein [Nocardia cyriacigeorgica]NEW41981.1 HD domain-containing protein [Nocardia cyriacigeorgica]NEW44763.1 HD domain-containing protein [Nocardia cyriacigeorgica]NEW50491.1 HD domain-containing protein [Nocardia cyriacigeorgica]NEW59331.1 HD domain-containing protein [Nocardia cyriacigeorgica]